MKNCLLRLAELFFLLLMFPGLCSRRVGPAEPGSLFPQHWVMQNQCRKAGDLVCVISRALERGETRQR